MNSFCTRLEQLERPRLLVISARFAARRYNRERHLRGLILTDELPPPARAFALLLAQEREMEFRRKAGAGHVPSRHVAMLGALIGEALLADADAEPRVQDGPAAIEPQRLAS